MLKLFKKITIFSSHQELKPVYFTIAASEFSVGIIRPVLPFLIFSVSSSLLPATLSHSQRAVYYAAFVALYKVGSTLSNPVFGTLSDFFGRKLIFYISVIAMLILALGAVISIFTGNVLLFISVSFLFGFSWAQRAVATAAINDVSDSNERITNLSIMQFFIGIGVCLGPIAGGVLGDFSIYGYQYILPYFFLLFISLILLFYIHLAFQETFLLYKRKPLKIGSFPLKKLMLILNARRVYFLLLICVLGQLSWGAYYEYIPVVAKITFNYNVKHVGLLSGMLGVALIFTTGCLLPVLNKMLSNIQLIKLSCIISVFGTVSCYVFSFFPHLLIADIMIWASILPIVAGDVMIFCILIAYFSESVSKELQGSIVGIVYVVASLMWIISAALGGVLMHWRLNGPLIIGPISMTLLLILIFAFAKKIEMSDPGGK